MKKFVILATLLFAVGAVFAAEDIVTHKVTAQGPTRDAAIKNALAQAVAQVRGTEMSSGDVSVGLRSDTIGLDTVGDDKTVSIDSVAIRGEGTTLKAKTAGYVKSYEVIEEQKTDDSYSVTLEVDIYIYDAPDKSGKRRIAVMPLRATRKQYAFFDKLTAAPEMVKIMSFKLTSLLADTNRFVVLDRDYLAEFTAERGIVLSDAASVKEKAKLGELMGADYIITGTIMRAEIKRETRMVQALGRKVAEYKADIVFDYRMINAPTGQIKLADQVNISLDNDEVIVLIDDRDRGAPDALAMRDKLVEMAAKKAVQTIVERLYPVKVAAASPDGQLILNQGGRRLQAGQLYEVFQEGQDVIDPDTNEKLTVMERSVGIIKIVKVTPAVTYAVPVSGDVKAFQPGMVCRFKSPPPAPARPKGRTGDIERTNQGGVKLPFD